MKNYAIIKKPYNPEEFSIYYVRQYSYPRAIEDFKRSSNFTKNTTYSIFDLIEYEDGTTMFFYITEF